MIKFKELIHKETGLTIKYEDWLKSYEQNGEIAFYGNKFELYPNEEENEELKYTPPCKFMIQTKDIIFSDDFEIVYDSDFLLDELNIIHRLVNTYIEKHQGIFILTQEFTLKNKLKKMLNL